MCIRDSTHTEQYITIPPINKQVHFQKLFNRCERNGNSTGSGVSTKMLARQNPVPGQEISSLQGSHVSTSSGFLFVFVQTSLDTQPWELQQSLVLNIRQRRAKALLESLAHSGILFACSSHPKRQWVLVSLYFPAVYNLAPPSEKQCEVNVDERLEKAS